MNSIDPVLLSLKGAIDTLKYTLHGINNVLDPNSQNNLKMLISNLKTSSEQLSTLLDSKTGPLAKTLENTNQFTDNLNKNNTQLNSIFENIKITSNNLSQTKFKETVDTLQKTLGSFQMLLEKLQTKEGSMGLFINDPTLYNNLQQTGKSLNTLIDDIKVHPKRYINITVFGKKDKSKPLSAPLADSAKKE